MEIAVVGAGLIGLTTALRLSQAGHAVRVIAPVSEDHMASPGNAGTVAAYAVDPVGTPDVLRDLPRLLFNPASPLAIHRPSALPLAPWLLRFLAQSRPAATQRNRAALAELLRGVNDDWHALAAEIGASALIRRGQALYVYDSAKAVKSAESAMNRRRDHGVAVEVIDAQALAARQPGLPSGRFAGAAAFADTLWFSDPNALLPALARAANTPRIDARVTTLTPQGAGWRLTLNTGETLDTQAVVLAAGAWSARLLRPLGLRIPLTSERGYHLEYDLPDHHQPVTAPVCPVAQGFYFTPMAGRLRVAGTVELGGTDKPPSPHRWDRLEAGARSVFPDLPPPARRWMGLRPSIPDSLPVIGAARPGLVLAFGHGHIGLTLAPRTARLVQDALTGRATPDALAPSRF